MSEQTSGESASAVSRLARVARRRRVVGGAIVVAMVMLLASGYVGLLSYRTTTQGSALKDRATTLIERADATVVAVDEVVRANITPDLAGKAATATAEVGTAEATLATALELLAQAAQTLRGAELDQARLLQEAAAARQEMLAQARPILAFNASAAQALADASDAWTWVLRADKLADRSVVAYNKLTTASVSESARLSRRAAAAYTEARKGFASAEQAFPDAPFERYLTYVDARLALSAISKRSEQAWLSGDYTKANAAIAEYNVGDRRAVALAIALPASPDLAVANAYAKAADAATRRYYAARERAVAADAQLRK